MNKQLSLLKQLFFSILMLMLSLQANGKTTYNKWESDKLSTLQGKGTEDDPYLITSAKDFATFATAVYDGKSSFNGKYILQTADISFNPEAVSSGKFDGLSTITYALPAGSKWGWSSDYFKGIYDGGGHKISGLYYSTKHISNIQWMGVFGGLKNAVVKNLTIEDCYFDLSSESGIENSFGILAGRSENSIIANCEVMRCKMNISNTESGTDIGGFIGHVENGTTIMNCSLLGRSELNCQTTRSAHIGGFVGYCKVDRSSKNSSVNVKNSEAYGDIKVNTTLDRNLDGFMYSGLLNTSMSAGNINDNSTVNISGCTDKMYITVYTPTIKDGSSKKYQVTGMSVNSFANWVDRVEDCLDESIIIFGDSHSYFKNGLIR